MAKKNKDKWESKHLRNMARYARQIDEIYKSAMHEAAAIGANTPYFDPNKPFSFNAYPSTKQKVEKLLDELKSSILTVVLNGIDAEWTLSNNKNNELANVVFGENNKRLSDKQRRLYYRSNDKARQAFAERKVSGLNLSDRVWKYTEQFKSEIEMGIDLGLRDGLSADQMSRQLRQYLQHPDKLFRRVRDEHGVLHLSKQAAAYHPGTGVYRSSYKNARRLAATETNIAYRTSDHLRWKKFDFVVGIEIKLSNNHTLNGVEFHDICDTLAGKYPKDFKFTGWHPHCRCHAVTILKTDEEMAEDTRKILNGEPLNGNSVNRIDDVPRAFKEWITNNKDRIAISGYKGTTPYFLIDNEQYVHFENFVATKQQIAIIESRNEYLAHDIKQWRKEVFDRDSGGYLVVDRQRAANGGVNKQERDKFNKERAMAETYALNGHKVEMLAEVPRVSSPDVLIDGLPADLKRTGSHNNIVNYAKKAVREQGAELVLFQLDTMTPEIRKELNKLKSIGIRCKYFITGEGKVYSI